MSKPYIKIGKNFSTDALGISSNVGEVIHPNEWIIYKYEDGNFVLCLDHVSVRAGCIYVLMSHAIASENDNIDMFVSDDTQTCMIFTENYKYMFKKSEKIRKRVKTKLV